MMTKQNKLALLLSLFFAIGVSADPIFHAWEGEEDHHSEYEVVECQFCESEQSETLEQYELQISELVSDNLTSLKGSFVSSFQIGFSARAPPLS